MARDQEKCKNPNQTYLPIVAEALVKYINQGITLGSVNMPEVNLRSMDLDEPNHARVIYIHQNVPGVLRKGENRSMTQGRANANKGFIPVNEILGDHNVDKQISDSKGDVGELLRLTQTSANIV